MMFNLSQIIATGIGSVLGGDYHLYAVYIDSQSRDSTKIDTQRTLIPVPDLTIKMTLPTKPAFKQIVSVHTGAVENITIYKMSILYATAPLKRNYIFVPCGSNSMYSLLTEVPNMMINTVMSNIEFRYEGERW